MTRRAEHYGMNRLEACELARVALDAHQAPVTQIVAAALRLLKEASPGTRLVISYADPAQGHLGTIYQAGNWTYVGRSGSVKEYFVGGHWIHNRTVNDHRALARRSGEDLKKRFYEWEGTLPTRQLPPKFIYLYGLDRPAKRAIAPGLPYPSAEQVSEARRHPSGVEG